MPEPMNAAIWKQYLEIPEEFIKNPGTRVTGSYKVSRVGLATEPRCSPGATMAINL